MLYEEKSKIKPLTETQRIELGLRKPFLEVISFEKTKEEKEEIKLLRKKVKFEMTIKDTKEILGRLVVHVKNTTKSNTFKTTYNIMIYKHDISTFLEVNNIEKKDIIKIYFNNKIYK
jgi:hypothetical protein